MKNENEKNEQRFPYFELDYGKLNGIVPASILDAKTGLYLMTGFMNEESYRQTLNKGEIVFWSRSRKELWYKGEKSGDKQIVKTIKKGCEDDILAIYVNSIGPICHRKTWTCFDNPLLANITREERFGSEKKCPYCGK